MSMDIIARILCSKNQSNISELQEVSHTHANKALLDTYTQTEVDLADAVNKSHEHDNIIPISKLTEDANGNPAYGGKPLGEAGQLIVQTYEDLPVDKPAGTVARTLETCEGLFTGVVNSLQEGDVLDVVEIIENIAFNGVSSAEEPEGLDLHLEDESGNHYGVFVYMFNLDGNPILIYEYGFEGVSDSSDVLYVYTPDSFTAPEDFDFLELSAGWNLFDAETPSVTPVAYSELPGIPNNMEVGGVGEEAGLVYPHLRITSYRVNPAGEYIFNGTSWIYQDYAYKRELEQKVDKENVIEGVSYNGNPLLATVGSKILNIYTDYINDVTDFIGAETDGVLLLVEYADMVVSLTLDDDVVIELPTAQEMVTGYSHMIYMQLTCSADVNISFAAGVDVASDVDTTTGRHELIMTYYTDGDVWRVRQVAEDFA